jgi:hypothetical protein
MTDTSAKLNGESVGPMHQGGFYRFKYEVTPLVKLGVTNKLEVEVAKHSANESVNKAERLADYWVFGGIYRPVYLEIVPPEFIERVAIDARADGTFAMEVFANGVSGADSVWAQVKTLEGKKVGPEFATLGIDPFDGTQSFRLTVCAPSPKQWTAETPNLYRVEVQLKRDNAVLHQITQRFGFRTFEVRDGDGLYLNGKKIILKGVNRHSFWPDSGRCLSEAVHRLDIKTVKDMNGNAVRMSHYPPDVEFLDLCDELGLYVLDELAGWHNHYDNEIGPKLVESMVTRDVNHPSILFWDNGNEGGFNLTLDKLFGQFDPQQRRVLHPWAAFGGLNTAHYLAYSNAQIAASGAPMYYHEKLKTELVNTNLPSGWIYMPTEFMHGLYDGGGGAGLEDYWNMMMSSSNCAGGFIWAFCDESVKRPDTGAMDSAGNQAPDGIVGPYREREGSFYAIKDIWSPIQVKRETNGTFTVENHYSFTDTEDCKFTRETRSFPTTYQKSAGAARARSPSIAPGKSGTIAGPIFPDRVPLPDVLALRIEDPSGYELGTWTWPLRSDDRLWLTRESGAHAAVPIETNDVISITAGELMVTFSKQTGLLVQVRRGTQVFPMTNGPRLAAGSSRLREIHSNADGSDAVVFSSFDGDLKTIFWRVKRSGWINCNYTYAATVTNDFLGVLFDCQESLIKRKRWQGDGPFRVWKNRMRGVTFGVWENDYNDTITGYRDWKYPEFKGCFSNVRWLQLETTEGLITVVPEGIPFVQVLTPGQPPDDLVAKTKVNLPECGLGFLHAIPPIGTKFKPADQGGPQGQPNVGQGEYSGTISFYFGKLP